MKEPQVTKPNPEPKKAGASRSQGEPKPQKTSQHQKRSVERILPSRPKRNKPAAQYKQNLGKASKVNVDSSNKTKQAKNQGILNSKKRKAKTFYTSSPT